MKTGRDSRTIPCERAQSREPFHPRIATTHCSFDGLSFAGGVKASSTLKSTEIVCQSDANKKALKCLTSVLLSRVQRFA